MAGHCRVWGCLALLLGVPAVAIAVVVALNFAAIADWVDNLDAVLDDSRWAGALESAENHLAFVAAHRDDVALVTYALAPDGARDPDAFSLEHNADEPMTLASTMKIVVLGAYARGVVAGEIDPEEVVPMVIWEAWYLHGTDGGAHGQALDELGHDFDERGFAVDREQKAARLDQIVWAMIRWSDNAATDLVIEVVGRERLDAFIRDAGLDSHDPIEPVVHSFLSWRNHSEPEQGAERLAALRAMSPQEWEAHLQHQRSLWSDVWWRKEERQWRARSGGGRVRYQAGASRHLMPRGTARAYADLMARIASDRLFSPEVCAVMRKHLEWPMAFASNQRKLERFGTKGGSLPGVLTGALYAQPKGGPTKVVALFHRGMPMSAYLSASSSFSNQLFSREILMNPAFADRVAAALTRSE